MGKSIYRTVNELNRILFLKLVFFVVLYFVYILTLHNKLFVNMHIHTKNQQTVWTCE